MRVFFFHYNKPATLKAKGKVKISLHWKNRCFILEKLKINVPVWTHVNKKAPRLVCKGKANEIVFNSDGTGAIIV